jgi:hypothetical protein
LLVTWLMCKKGTDQIDSFFSKSCLKRWTGVVLVIQTLLERINWVVLLIKIVFERMN